LNIKHGASQLYLAGGGGSNYLAPALATRIGGQGPSLGARVGPCWWEKKNLRRTD